MRLQFVLSVVLSIATSHMFSSAKADIIVSEFHPTGSSGAAYGADWFELTNTGTSMVDIAGWRFDDNSNLFANAVELMGVASLSAGQSAIFIEGTAATVTAFSTAWFGANVPTGFTMGTYTGSGIGLGSGGDAINIFNAAGVLQTNVTFGAATLGVTFDNTAGGIGTVTQLSVVGNNGAFTSAVGGEIGSPGFRSVTAVPEPTSVILTFSAIVCLGIRRMRRVCF